MKRRVISPGMARPSLALGAGVGAGVWPMVAEAMQLPNIIQQEGQTFRLLPKEFWRLDPLGRVQVSGDQGNTWTLTSSDFVLQNDQLYVEDARFHEISAILFAGLGGGIVTIAGLLALGNVHETDDALVPTTDTVDTNEDTDLVISVADLVANDINVDAHTLSITAVSNGTHGTVTFNQDQTQIIYSPFANYNGTDSFTYTVSDGQGRTEIGTVEVTVQAVNDAPQFLGSVQITMIEGEINTGYTPMAIDVDVDADGKADQDHLTYSIVGGEDRELFEISDDGKLVFIDAPAFSVSSDNDYFVEIQAQDPHGATDVVHVSVTVSAVRTDDFDFDRFTEEDGWKLTLLSSAAWRVTKAGDVNGDGLDDILISDRTLQNSDAYVIFGQKNLGVLGGLEDVIDQVGGFKISTSGDHAVGSSIQGIGDINGDGFADVMIGASNYGVDGGSGDQGAGLVVFGKADGIDVDITESSSSGFLLTGENEFDQAGSYVGSGDFNGDGIRDLLIVAQNASPEVDNEIRSGAGLLYVVYGKENEVWTGQTLTQSPEAKDGFAIAGPLVNSIAGSYTSVGDINGDGLDDIAVVYAVGQDDFNNWQFHSRVVYGRADQGFVDLNDVVDDAGLFIKFGETGNSIDVSVPLAAIDISGDINGDGIHDILFNTATMTGVIFGQESYDSPIVLPDQAAGLNAGWFEGQKIKGFIIKRPDNASTLNATAILGGINGDGRDDIALLIPETGTNRLGVVYGTGDEDLPDNREISVSDIEAGTRGFFINSVPRSINFGTKIDQRISPAGDVNGDGFDDFLVSVADFSGSSTFLIFGGNFNQSVTTVGTSDNNVMLGSANDEIIYAGLGDDTLYMSAGDDRLSGGEGADTYVAQDVSGTTTIIDFQSHSNPVLAANDQSDRIDVTAFTMVQDMDDLAIEAVGSGGRDTAITLDNDTVLILEGVRPGDLVADDFLFFS